MVYTGELSNTYDIYEQIGAGGGGIVYKAVHKRLQKEVVLKKLKGNMTSIAECRTEVDILKNLRHSYLPQVLDFIESPEGIFTVMDFIPGKSLKQMLEEKRQLSEKEVLKYAKQLCEAMDYLHSQSPAIIHGDIKPDNIMITPEGNVCLIDFNISGILEGGDAQTFGCTPGFSAPEQMEAFEALINELNNPKAPVPQVKQPEVRQNLPGDKTVKIDTALLMGGRDTVLLNANYVSEKTTVLELSELMPAYAPQNNAAAPQKEPEIKGISINKRSDIYSLGATFYTLLTGEIWDPYAKHKQSAYISDGFWIVLTKSLERQPGKRYQDAGKMLQAILEVHKKDKAYKRLFLRQELTIIMILLVMAGSVLSIVAGKKRMQIERQDYYYQLLEQIQEENTVLGDTELFEQLYTEAVALQPEYLEAYYEKAYNLFIFKRYEDAAVYIKKVLELNLKGSDIMYSNLYHIYAECYFQMEDYDSAKIYYKEAINHLSNNPVVFRDYAITLVYTDEVEQAEKVLAEALSKGIEQADVYLVQGEIERKIGNLDKAIECFEKVIEESKDEYVQHRAYIMASKTFEEIGTEDAFLKDIAMLDSASKKLTMNNRALVYERLVRDYIKLGEMKQDNSYYAKAETVLQDIVTMNWDSYVTYSNAIILCLRIGDMEKADKWVLEMQQKYPENYVTYMRAAYLEIEKQDTKKNEDRDYALFKEYYTKANTYYDAQKSGNATDTEMQRLKQIYQEIVDGGWLK